jgi:hypothetical protein
MALGSFELTKAREKQKGTTRRQAIKEREKEAKLLFTGPKRQLASQTTFLHIGSCSFYLLSNLYGSKLLEKATCVDGIRWHSHSRDIPNVRGE